MSHGGGGGGMSDPHQNPVNATVGTLTAGLTFFALWHLLAMPFVRPAMAMRTLVCAFVLAPATMIAGENPFTHFWWDITVVIGAGWISEAKEKGQ